MFVHVPFKWKLNENFLYDNRLCFMCDKLCGIFFPVLYLKRKKLAWWNHIWEFIDKTNGEMKIPSIYWDRYSDVVCCRLPCAFRCILLSYLCKYKTANFGFVLWLLKNFTAWWANKNDVLKLFSKANFMIKINAIF